MAQQAIFVSAGAELQELGLNPKSMAVLAIIELLPHPQEIAISLGAPFPTISNILKELEKLGYVERSLAVGDRRRTLITQTAKGIQARDAAIQAINRQSRPLMAGLTAEEQATFAGLLQKLTSPR